MDKILLKTLGVAFRKHYPIEPMLTPRMQALLLRIAAAESKPAPRCCNGARLQRAAS